MNDVNLDGATLKLAEPGSIIPKGSEILVDIDGDHIYDTIDTDNYRTLPSSYAKTYIVQREQNWWANVPVGAIYTGTLTADHIQVSVTKDPTYTVSFTLNSVDSGPIVASGLSNTDVDDIVQTFEAGDVTVWVRTGDNTEHVIPTHTIQLIKITEEDKA